MSFHPTSPFPPTLGHAERAALRRLALEPEALLDYMAGPKLYFVLGRSTENFQWYWDARSAGNHQIVAYSGETYFNRTDCERMMRAVMNGNDVAALQRGDGLGGLFDEALERLSSPLIRYEIWQNVLNKQWYWRAEAVGNNRLIACGGEGYHNRNDCLRMMNAIKRGNRNAEVRSL